MLCNQHLTHILCKGSEAKEQQQSLTGGPAEGGGLAPHPALCCPPSSPADTGVLLGRIRPESAVCFSSLTFPEDFMPLNKAAPTIIQDRSRQRARYHTMLPVSSSPLERWRATLLEAQNSTVKTMAEAPAPLQPLPEGKWAASHSYRYINRYWHWGTQLVGMGGMGWW